ncbi:MAG: hypothetical protein R8L53_05940 [Mariprofundales bacterium]
MRKYLQGQITQDVTILSPKQAIFAALLSPHGKTIAELYVIDASNQQIPALYLLVPSHKQDAVIKRLQRFVLRDDVSIQHADDIYLYTLQCLAMKEYNSLLTNQNRYSCVWQDELCIIRQAECCADGVWVLSPKHLNVANSHIDNNTALLAWDMARIIYGTPRFGVDWDEADIPLNAGLTRREGVSFSKGCYVGQEIISRMHCRDGVRKCLLHIRANQLIIVGQEVHTTSKVGVLTSVAYDDKQQCWFAIARLPLSCIQSSLSTINGVSLLIITQAG